MELTNKDYLKDLNKIKETIKENQNKAMVVVNSAMILTYYEIGTIINKRKTWGSKYIEKLSIDLKEYGKGYSYDNLYRMAQLASNFNRDEIMAQPVPQIPWSSIITIMQKSKTHEEMLWYINQTHKLGWSRNMVLNQFELKAYERSLITPATSNVVKSDDLTKELFKDTYVFNFLDKEKIKCEKDLKNQLINNIIKFLQELGRGFAFVGKEYKLKIDDEEFFIDLLMYNIELHSYIVIEVKIGKYSPENIGQLLFYTNAIDEYMKTRKDGNTIGLLLCRDANTKISKITLNNINLPIGISKYKFIEELPEYLEKRLNEKRREN